MRPAEAAAEAEEEEPWSQTAAVEVLAHPAEEAAEVVAVEQRHRQRSVAVAAVAALVVPLPWASEAVAHQTCPRAVP